MITLAVTMNDPVPTTPAAPVDDKEEILNSNQKQPQQQQQEEEPQKSGGGGVIGWVKGKLAARNVAANMANIDLSAVEATATETGQSSELDIVTGLDKDVGGVDDEEGSQHIPEDERIDLEAENDEGLLVGWGQKLQEVQWVKKTVEVVQQTVEDRKHQEEMNQIYEKYKKEIKEDAEVKALNKKIKKLKGSLKVQRLNGDRTEKRNTFAREKEQKELDKKVQRLRKAIWTFANSSMNSHEYAKAMMRAAARLKRKGINVHKSEKALAMEAAVLRNMHRMLALQKQYTMSKRACDDVSSFIKRCKGWLDTKLASGEMGVMVLEATSKSMALLYKEIVDVQEEIKIKFEDPKNHTFKKERMKTVLALPKGLRSMPTFLKGPQRPPMRISLKKKITDDQDPALAGYKTFKERQKAAEEAFQKEMKEYEGLLEVGGPGTKIYEDDDVSDLGDSEDEIEEHLAEVKPAAAAAARLHDSERALEAEGVGGDAKSEAKSEGKSAKSAKSEDAGETLDSGGEGVANPDTAAPAPTEKKKKKENGEKKDDSEGADVDEDALPSDVKQEDLDNLLDKEVDETAPSTEDDGNSVEEGLNQVVDEALGGIGADITNVTKDDDEDEDTKVSS